MKKAGKFTIYLALYIIALFSFCILFTFINDALQKSGFFGDELFVPYKDQWNNWVLKSGDIDGKYVWGVRHYWYFTMCILLFILSIVRVIMWAAWYWNKNVFEKSI